MNILVSYNWIREFVKGKGSVKEFAQKISAVGNNVEFTRDLSKAFDHMVVGEVVELKAHPNADKLRLVSVLLTPIAKEGSGEVQIVCGGVNLFVGQRVAVALPGSRVRWHGEGELVELKETEIRGVKSFGMICAPEELGFEKLQQGERMIWDLTELTTAKPGTSLAKALDLDDVVFDIEVTTNRPDAMSVVGLAREAGAAGLGEFQAPITKSKTKSKRKISQLPNYAVTVQEKSLCPRYQAVVIENVKVAPSPWWMQRKLLLAGHRPINNVVDVTNYVLHELGQPLHAFDADTLEGEKIVVRRAKAGEKIKALDGKEYALDTSMLVIADAKRPVAVAGVMGGELTGTTERTTRLIIESANFDPVSVRKTARALTLYSDSSSQFEKGLSTESTDPALARAMELICELTGGHVASSIADVRANRYKPAVFPYDPQAVSDRIGVSIPAARQKEILKGLGFVVKGSRIEVPYWRDHDIEDTVDFSEEVARVYGYAAIPAALPAGVLPTPLHDPLLLLERRAKQALKAAGLTELYGYSFTSSAILKKLDWPLENVVRLSNPLSEEWEYLRPTLLPGVLAAVELNQHRFELAELFELAHTHEMDGNSLPKEATRLMIAVYEKDGSHAFSRAKGLVERLLRELGADAVSIEAKSPSRYLHPGRSAEIFVQAQPVGVIGELAPTYAERFGVDTRLTLVDVDLAALLPCIKAQKKFHPLPEFPEVRRDLSFLVDAHVTYDALHRLIASSHDLVRSATFADVYQGKGIELDKKSMTFSIELRSPDHTLTSEEADQAIQTVCDKLKKAVGAIMR